MLSEVQCSFSTRSKQTVVQILLHKWCPQMERSRVQSGPVHHIQYSLVVLGSPGSPRWTAMVTWPTVCLKWMWTWPGKLNRCRRSTRRPVAAPGSYRTEDDGADSSLCRELCWLSCSEMRKLLRCTSTPCFHGWLVVLSVHFTLKLSNRHCNLCLFFFLVKVTVIFISFEFKMIRSASFMTALQCTYTHTSRAVLARSPTLVYSAAI